MLIPYLKSNNLLKLESPKKGVTDDTDDTDTDTDTHRRSRPSLMQPLDRWSMAAKNTYHYASKLSGKFSDHLEVMQMIG